MAGGWRVAHPTGGSPTRLRLVLASGPSPLLGAEALVLVQPLQARPAILAGAARALADLCKRKKEKAATFHCILFWEASRGNAVRTGPLWYVTAIYFAELGHRLFPTLRRCPAAKVCYDAGGRCSTDASSPHLCC